MRALVLVATIVLVLTGCSPSNPTVTDGAHRLIVATKESRVLGGTGFSGPIGYDAAGCVVIGGDTVLVAPPGSMLQGGVMTLSVGESRSLKVEIGESTTQLGGSLLPSDSPLIPIGTKCSSKKFVLLA